MRPPSEGGAERGRGPGWTRAAMEAGRGGSEQEEEEEGGGSGSQPVEVESDDLTDSEESIFSGLEDSGSDSLTEEEEEKGGGLEDSVSDSGVDKNSKGCLLIRDTQVGDISGRKLKSNRKMEETGVHEKELTLENEYAEDSSDEEVL